MHSASRSSPTPSREQAALQIESVKFDPTNSHLRKQGYTHFVTVALGCSRKPLWWGTDAAPKWLVDVGLVVPQGKKYRRLRLANGTTVPGGCMPFYDSMTKQYIVCYTLHEADVKGRLGKVALTSEFVLSTEAAGVRFETISDAKFQRAKQNAVASVPLWVLVPRVRLNK